MSVWENFGFSQNPYSTKPITADDIGRSLLVGRATEEKQLAAYITSADTHPTVEGPNGVGKTSLVSVVGFALLANFDKRTSKQLFLPVASPFQLTNEEDINKFRLKVFCVAAITLLNHEARIRSSGAKLPDASEIKLWLQSPVIVGAGGGISIAGFGGTTSLSQAANTGAGFTEAGFVEHVKSWLAEAFPTSTSGGLICVLDNLELLETSSKARALLEAIRDEVLGVKGLRWVLCGARGIVRDAASSPRMQGVLSEPLELQPLRDENVKEVISRRIDKFKTVAAPYVPVEPDNFEHLYKVGNKNLRNAFKYSEDFVMWTITQGVTRPSSSIDKKSLIESWFAVEADKIAVAKGVGDRAWQVFDGIADDGGNISPGDYADFGFESMQAMRPHLKALEESNLIDSAVDDTDRRRKTISMTSRGWIVRYKRLGYSIP